MLLGLDGLQGAQLDSNADGDRNASLSASFDSVTDVLFPAKDEKVTSDSDEIAFEAGDDAIDIALSNVMNRSNVMNHYALTYFAERPSSLGEESSDGEQGDSEDQMDRDEKTEDDN